MTCIAQESLLKIIKSQQKTVKLKKLWKLQQVQSLRIGDSPTSTMHYTASCLMIPKKRLPLEGKPPNSIIMRSHEHCIADRMTEPSSTAYHKRRHRKFSKKRILVCAKLISLVWSLEIDSEDWDIIDLRRSLTPYLCQTMSRLSSPWWFHPSSTRISSLYNLYLAIWDVGDRRSQPYQPTIIQRISVYLSYNWLLL